MRLGTILYSSRKSPHGANPSKRMAFRDTWHRTLVYFGLAERP